MVKTDYPKWLQSLILWVAAATIFIFLTSDAWAMDGSKPLGQINQYLRLTGELYGSYEAWDFFRPSPAINNDNSYDLWAVRARLGALVSTSFVDAYAQAQYVGLYGLPNDAVATPGGPLGLGAAYFQANGSTNVSNIFFKTGSSRLQTRFCRRARGVSEIRQV